MESLPPDWSNGDRIQWNPGDRNQNHPTKEWLSRVWDYLREHFVTDEDLSRLEKLPLIPLDLSKVPITLTRLKKPSKVVIRRLDNDYLEKILSDVLTNLGVIVIEDCPAFWKRNLGVLNTFVHPPTVHGVLQAIAVSSKENSDGMISTIMLERVTNESKRALRNFISKASSLDPQEKALLLCLPLFQTLSNSEVSVSKKEGLCAAPANAHEFPVTPQRNFIDTKDEDSRKMVGLLDIRTLTPTEFLLDGIFPDVKDGKYSEEDIDQLIAFVMKRYQVYVGASTRFEAEMKALPFVPTLGGRARAMELFDPTKDFLRKLFADEDVFPTGAQYADLSVLAVLKKLGIKSEDTISAKDLYQSARKISEIPTVSTAELKAKAVMAYLEREPTKLQETVSGIALGELLREIPWICGMKQKPENYPRSLHFWGEAEEENRFFNPTEVIGKENVNLIGTVKPIVEVESSSQLAMYFGWNKYPHEMEVVKHLNEVTGHYTQDEKPRYMLLVKNIYSFLLRNADEADVGKTLQEIQDSRWIWNGDGFSAPTSILAERPSLDLTPYISCLPLEMKEYRQLFLAFGMEVACDASVLLRVLSLIKDKYTPSKPPFKAADVEKDLQLSITILNKLKGYDETLSPQLQEKVLIPTHVEGNAFVRLASVEECVYCDREWLHMESDDEEGADLFVHPDVSNSTAEYFNVRPLSNLMLDPDELEVGEEFGQEEKLTRRLNSLLEDYKDGFAVPKELIQNADDAGATEVRFLYDERTNEDAMSCLIDERMKECQGAALWVYNDAEFRNEDFENLTKLNAATKEHETEKIGKFGLGFNAVYNLTDVPMLVSRNYVAIFDPNTFYLGKAIRNKNKPGLRIDTNKNVKKLRNFRNQFKPFNGIFDCDLHLEKEDNSFHGTLFRFPLRTKEQAIRSEINSLPYDCKQVKDLLMLFIRGARSLLLFTQNVIRVSIFHLPKETTENPQPNLIFDVTKKLAKDAVLRELSAPFTLSTVSKDLSAEDQFLLKQCNFLRASSEVSKCAGDYENSSTIFLRSAITLDVKSTVTVDGSRFFGDEVHLPSGTERWLVASSMGRGEALQFSKQDKGLLPSAGVAVQLTLNDDSISVPVCRSNHSGSVFCYLPLPIHTGLPIHVNGAFAVASNRRSLKEKNEDDKACIGVDWNNVLLRDSVCAAYLDLIEDVKQLAQASGGTYQFHSLWPRSREVKKACEPLARSFYERLVAESLPLFPHGNRWVGVHEVDFLHPLFRRDVEIGGIAFEVFRLLLGSNKVVIDLPADIYESFVSFDLATTIQSGNYDKNRFFRELVFPKVASVPSQLRDRLVLYALDDKNGAFDDMIKTYPCIPASPHGQSLKCPTQLVSPKKEAGLLFSIKDGRFPHGTNETFLTPLRLLKLEQLGMLTDDLSWPEVAERAESVSILSQGDSDLAIQRIKYLMDFLEKKLRREDQSLPPIKIRTRILEAKFLPVLKKPTDFPLPWRGDEIEHNSLLAPEEAYLEDQKYLVCCTEPLVGVSISRNVKKLLKLDTRGVTLEQVIQQLTNAFSVRVDSLNSSEYKELQQVCRETYACLQQSLSDSGDSILEALQGKRFILVGRMFLSAQQVAFSLTADCSPYLFKLPQWIAEWFGLLMKAAGVKMTFVEHDYISSLCDIKRRFGGNTLDEQTLQVATRLAILLGETVKATNIDLSGAQGNWGVVHLPDSKGVMTRVPDLCIRDCPWMPDEEGVQLVNDGIPWPICALLGVKTRRQEVFRTHVFGIPFGQREKLTNRLKRILTGYPCEKEILKELLQNADDAQATEISFIKDPRNHPDERVFEDSWKLLQGPALCVYNNKPFTNADIEGIRNLGEGSKGEDPNKTGQYGVGFNAVYHLTDVPSFMSKGKEIGDVLCAFDPHCRYVPDATIQEPGIMFKDIAKLKPRFPDVFPCFLEDHFPIDNGTMFRFPLRTTEMARVSQISSSPVTLTMLDTMMKDLKKELFEVLLFVNNVKKITMCEVNDMSGRLTNIYSVEATMSKEDEAQRQAFVDNIKQIGEKINRGKAILPSDISVTRVSYVLNITDNLGSKEKWLIVQQIGFEKKLKESITNAFKKQELGMLPRGGVACLLEKTSRHSVEMGKKAYCFLPLPFETDLPVHINAHFALDHEGRRNLWRDEAGGYRSDWNNALLEDVVASCYLRLLDEVRNFLHLPVTEDATPRVLMCKENEMLQRIRAYERLFPLRAPTESYWRTLVDTLYQEVNVKGLKFLPVVRKTSLGATQQVLENTSMVEITWFPPTGNGKNQAFFNNLAETKPFGMIAEKKGDELQTKSRTRFEEILLESGFNLSAFSTVLHASFQRSQVPTCVVSPTSVVEFYKSISSHEPLCKIGHLPCKVKATPFRDALGVVLALLYCKGMKHFFDQLPGLPMLLREDDCLQLFSSKDPKYLPRFKDILPGSPQAFLHELVYRKFFSDGSILKSSVLKPLDAEGFTINLPQTLPHECYGKGAFVEWSPNQKTAPNQPWISRVWVFLGELTRDILDDPRIAEDSKRSQIKVAIGPLANWSILPANEVNIVSKPAAQLLVPLCKAASVLDYSSPDATNQNVVEVLRKLGVPELNDAMLSTLSSGTPMFSSSNAVSVARLMVSSMKVPKSLLTALDQKIEMDPQSPGKLVSADCNVLLEYFSRSVSSLKETDGSKLRKLPFYLATHGGFIRLDQHPRACVLPNEIPRKELDVLEHKLGVIFLESWENLSSLFKFLALQCLSAVDVYCKCILPNLHIFSQDVRNSHLEFIRKDILSSLETSDDDEQRFLDCLRNTPFIPSADGSLKTASSFYDPYVEVFTTMLSSNSFPPKPHDSIEWLKVLRRIGLVGVVSQDDFKRFARDVAREAATEPTVDTKKKSKVLVEHLMRRPNVVGEGLLQAVCDIRFVATEPVRKDLQGLCQPFQATTNSQSYFCAFKRAAPSHHAEVVWTKTHLLPSWADPTHHTRDLGCPPGVKRDHYCDDFIAKLQIMKTPSVDLVIAHCQNICFYLESKSERVHSSPMQCATKTAVMERIYDFLQSHLITNDETKELSTLLLNTPCILVEKGKKFILPSQTVLDLYDDLEIKPFLYRLPLEFGKFHRLFQRIGCCKHVTISHYAMVLKKLYERCKNAKLHPNEVTTCIKAGKGFFEQLENKVEEVKGLLELHLPGIPPQRSFLDAHGRLSVPVTMHQSIKLIFNDQSPARLDRLQTFEHHFLLDLKKINVTYNSTMTNYRELVMKLPTAIRPKMLSSVVDEKLSDSQSNVSMTSEDVTLMKQRLSSPQFFSGLVRLIRDENSQIFDEEVIGQIKNELQGIEICAVSNLKTSLFYDSNPIPESEATVYYFLDRRTTSSGETLKLYLDAVSAMADKTLVISWVSHVIVELYGGLLGKRAGLIFQILNCSPSGIWSLLDSLNVRPDDSNCGGEVNIFPDPGTFIPLDEHHLLNDAFEEFEPGEYVGYEVEDPSLHQEEGVATYIYARIVKEVTDQDYPLVARRYKIDIGGNEEKDVDATDLYKFHRVESPTSSAIVVSDFQGQNSVEQPRSRSKQEVFDKISDLLEEAWKMPEDKRRKVIKRLYLRWHPDKNVGDEEFCNEVCKHLQSEIARLERGEPRGSQQAPNMGAGGTQHGSYDDFFASWRRRARQHHTQREGYRTRGQFYGGAPRRPNPQPGEARRWFRQAQADISAVENDIAYGRPSYEWACFKCHQV